MKENKTINKKQRIYLIVGIVLFLILVLSASYAYFAITSVNNATTTTVTGTGEEIGTPTLTTTTPKLGINLTAEMMSNETAGNYRYYATPDNKGLGFKEYDDETYEETDFDTVLTPGNGRYELATATLDKGVSLNCTYSYNISATVTKEMQTYETSYIVVVLTNNIGQKTTYKLGQLLNGVTYSGKIIGLEAGNPQKLYVESYVQNSVAPQEGLVGNTYTINITPKSGTTGFKCDVSLTERMKNKNVADYIANNYNTIDNIWSSSYENDGYRYEGINEITDAKNPLNFVCFGTTNKNECTSNPDKYMYRIIGAFQEENGDGTINTSSPYHLKLIKMTSIGNYAWHSTTTEVPWANSDLYKGLNGSYFLTNTNYDYMQNNTWKNKIFDWKWVASKMATESVTSFLNTINTENKKNLYLYETNRSGKTIATGSWTYPTAKIGLMSASDYYFSLGTMSTNFQKYWLSGYLNQSEKKDIDYNSNLNRFITSSEGGNAVTQDIQSSANYPQTRTFGTRPVFYLKSDIQFSSGYGAYTNPYIIK